jgi:hypothetical protein
MALNDGFRPSVATMSSIDDSYLDYIIGYRAVVASV